MGLCKLECYTDKDESIRYSNKPSEKCQRNDFMNKPFKKLYTSKFETFTNTTERCGCDSYLKAEKESIKSSESEINSDPYKPKCTYCKEPVTNCQSYKKYDQNYDNTNNNSQKRRRKVNPYINIVESSTPLEETESVEILEDQSEILSTSNKCCACICPCYIKKRSIDVPVKEAGRKAKNELFTESVKYFNNLINNSEKPSPNDSPRTKNKDTKTCSCTSYQTVELPKTNNIEEQVSSVANMIYSEENKPTNQTALIKISPDKTDKSAEEKTSTKDDEIIIYSEEEKYHISLTESSNKGCVCDLSYVSKKPVEISVEETNDLSVKDPMDLSAKTVTINSRRDQSNSSKKTDLNSKPDYNTEKTNFSSFKEIKTDEQHDLIHCSCCPFSCAEEYTQLTNLAKNEPKSNENQNPNYQQDCYNYQNKTNDKVNTDSDVFHKNSINTKPLKDVLYASRQEETIVDEPDFTSCSYNLEEKKLLLMKLLKEELSKAMSHDEKEKERLVNEHKQCFCSCPCKSLMDEFSKSFHHEHHHSVHSLETRLTEYLPGSLEKNTKTSDKKLVTNSSSLTFLKTKDLLTNDLLKQALMLTVEKSQNILNDSNLNEKNHTTISTSTSTQEFAETCSTKCAAKGEPAYYSNRSIHKHRSLKESESGSDFAKQRSSLKEASKYQLRPTEVRELLKEIKDDYYSITKGSMDEDDMLSKKSIKFSLVEDAQWSSEKLNKKLENGSYSGCKCQKDSSTEGPEKFKRESHMDDLKYCKAKKAVQTKCKCQCLCLQEKSFDDEHFKFDEDERKSERLERRNEKKNKKRKSSCILRCKELSSFPCSTEEDVKIIEDYFRNQKKNANRVKTDKSKYYYFLQNTKCQIAADYEAKARTPNVEKINYNFLTLEAQQSDTSVKSPVVERASVTSEDNRKLFDITETTSITEHPEEVSLATVDFKSEAEKLTTKVQNLPEDEKTWDIHTKGLSANLDTYGSLEKIVSANLIKGEHRGSGLSVLSTTKEPASVFEEILREEKKKLSKHSATASMNSRDSHAASASGKVRGRGSSRFFDFFRGWMTNKSDIKQKRFRKKKIIKIRESDEDVISDSLSDETVQSTIEDDDLPSHRRVSLNSNSFRHHPSSTLRQPV